jgi:hypothetical protein
MMRKLQNVRFLIVTEGVVGSHLAIILAVALFWNLRELWQSLE